MELLKVEDVASMLNLKPSTIRMWIFKKKIRVVKLGRAVRIPKDFVQELIEENTKRERSLTRR